MFEVERAVVFKTGISRYKKRRETVIDSFIFSGGNSNLSGSSSFMTMIIQPYNLLSILGTGYVALGLQCIQWMGIPYSLYLM